LAPIYEAAREVVKSLKGFPEFSIFLENVARKAREEVERNS
jgi:hypothetical protein